MKKKLLFTSFLVTLFVISILFLIVVYRGNPTPVFEDESVSLNIPSTDSINIYVSGNGSDSNSGSRDNPLKTFEGARQLVRSKLASAGSKNVVVYFREGVYELGQPIVFTPEDSHPGNAQVIYRNFPDEVVRIHGSGLANSGWVNVGDDIWEKEVSSYLDSNGEVRQLFVDGVRINISRYPENNSYLKVSSVSDKYKTISYEQTIPSNILTNDTELSAYVQWNHHIVKISNFASPSTLNLESPGGYLPDSWVLPAAGDIHYLQNVELSSINSTEVWSFDSSRNVIRYKTSLNPNGRTIYIPKNENLVRFEGKDESRRVENITLQGIEFVYNGGYVLNRLESSDISRDGTYRYGVLFGLEYFNDPQNPGELIKDHSPAAISAVHSNNIHINNNVVANTGGTGIFFINDVNNSSIQFNRIYNIGSNCVTVGGVGFVKNIKVSDNDITGCGDVNHGSVGIHNGITENVEILNNRVQSLPYSGITVGQAYGSKETWLKNTLVRGNLVNNVMNKLADGGGIYTAGYNPEGKILSNVVYGVQRNPHVRGSASVGMYFDCASRGYTFDQNIVNNVNGKYIYLQPEESDCKTWEKDIVMGSNYIQNNNFPVSLLTQAGPRGITGPSGLIPIDFNPDQLDIEEYLQDSLDLFAFQTQNTKSGKIEAMYLKQSSEWRGMYWRNTIDLPVGEGIEYVVETEHFNEGNNSSIFIQTKGTNSGNVELVYAFPNATSEISFAGDPLITDLDAKEDYIIEIEKAGDEWYLMALQLTNNPEGKVRLKWLEIDWLKNRPDKTAKPYDATTIATQTTYFDQSSVRDFEFDIETDANGETFIQAFQVNNISSNKVEMKWLDQANNFTKVLWPDSTSDPNHGIIGDLPADGREYIFEYEDNGLIVFYKDNNNKLWESVYLPTSELFTQITWRGQLPF